jgi:hypothetical protein
MALVEIDRTPILGSFSSLNANFPGSERYRGDQTLFGFFWTETDHQL